MLEIDVIIEKLSEKYGVKVFFDDSRLWTLAYKDSAGDYFGVQRPYLGGGVRGAIRSNLEGEMREDFEKAMKDIEAVINHDTADGEVWEQNTGVLL